MGHVQGFVHQQLHTFEHAADAQRDIALGAVDFKRQVVGFFINGAATIRGQTN